MGRTVPADQGGMGELLPSSLVLVEGRHFDMKPTGNGKHNYNCRAEVIEPTELAGNALFDSFVIGSDDDPEAMQPETMKQSFGMKRCTSMFEAMGHDVRGEDEETFAEKYIGGRYLAAVLRYAEPALKKDGTPNPYGGIEKNRVTRYFTVGEREPMVMPDGAGATAVTGTPKATVKTAPAAAPKATPAATPPAPKVPPAKAAAAKPAPAAAASPGAALIKCVVPDCDFHGPLKEFPGHVAAAHPE